MDLVETLKARAVARRLRDVRMVGEANVRPIEGFFDWLTAAEIERLRVGENNRDELILTLIGERDDLRAKLETLKAIDLARAKQYASARKALTMFVERVERYGNWDDGCFYYGATSASELQEPLALSKAALTDENGKS